MVGWSVGCCMGFTKVYSRRATGFHRQAKLFDFNFFDGKSFL